MNIEKRTQLWLALDRTEATRTEVERLIDRNDQMTLKKFMGTDMEFGTAGLRGVMGAGFSRMNNVTVIQASQGLAEYLLCSHGKEACREKGVIIGYDGRHNSKHFARHTANVFLNAGFKTLLFSVVVPTPFVAFGVRHCKTLAGVMVTASHNAKQYNGYKVYNERGAQIKAPIDKEIVKCIKRKFNSLCWNFQPGAIDCYRDVFSGYYTTLNKEWHFKELNRRCPIRFTYTAMHGVGYPFTMEVLKQGGFPAENIIPVKEQIEPDPEFRTVIHPNPEEGEEPLRLSIKTADAHNSTVILANDPDADRLALAEKSGPNGTWRIFTGNEMGILFSFWALMLHKKNHPEIPLNNCVLMTTIVSSRFMSVMAKAEGFHYEETLTGFKYMGNLSEDLVIQKRMHILLSYEDAIGFSWGDRVRDKDGVTAAGMMAEMCAWLYEQHKHEGSKAVTLSAQLERMYQHYGWSYEYNNYMITSPQSKTTDMFDELRKMGKNGGYPAELCGAKILNIRDLGLGYDSEQIDKKARLPVSRSAPIFTFSFDNGITLSIRGSGTEPKIKWYSELITKDNRDDNEDHLHQFVDAVIKKVLQPEKYLFTPRAKL